MGGTVCKDVFPVSGYTGVSMQNKPLRSTDIRERNEKIILRLIRDRVSLSQSETVLATGLKAPSVFRIFTELERKGFISLSSSKVDMEDRKGRKPALYSINPSSFYAVGVDFWSGSAAVSIADFCGNTLHTDITLFEKSVSADKAVAILITMVERAIRTSGVAVPRILGIGVGAPGRVDLEKGTIISYPRIAGMEAFPLSEKLSVHFGLPVYLQNNCSLIALSERRYGSAKDVDSLLTILIRSGVGGAFIDRGRLFTARGRSAMEIGHMSIACDGRPCSCGGNGCLETWISEDAIVADLAAVFALRSFDDLEDAIKDSRERVEAALSPALEVFERGIRNLYQLFSPDAFLVVSRSAAYAGILREHMQRACNDLLRADGGKVAFLADQYDPAAAGRGAADLVFDRYLE